MSDTPPVIKPEIKGASRSLLIGAFCAFGLLILAIILGAVSVGSGIRHLKKYSSPQALELTISLDDTTYQKALHKFSEAVKNAQSGKTAEINLSVDELNSFLAHDESFSSFRNILRVKEFKDDLIHVEASFPLKRLHWSSWTAVADQHLNGIILFRLRQKENLLFIEFNQFSQQGQKINLDTIESLKEHNSLFFWPAADQYQQELKLVRQCSYDDSGLKISFGPEPEDD